MAKTPTDIRSLARAHTETAINALVGVVNNGTSEPARVSAAQALLDRGWGKPTQPIAGDEDSPLNVIHKIERVLVDPKNRDA